jgi:hypothetical protein
MTTTMNGTMIKTEIPTHIEVGPYKFAIAFVEDPALEANKSDKVKTEEDSLSGCIRFEQQTIYIASSQTGTVLADTILHEMLHAIWAVVGGWASEIDEEVVVSMITTTLLDTLRRNKALTRMLFEL